MTGPLAGRRIVLTGASRGIGRTIAVELAHQGASLALVSRSAAALKSVLSELEGGPHRYFAFDVRDVASWREASAELAVGGLIHGVVTAAAALTPIGAVGSWGIEEFRSTLDLNVTGTLLPITSSLEALKRARGSIVTFSGGGATAPFVRFDAYAASKAAVVRLTENLAVELAVDHVRANSVAPGFVVTAMHNETIEAGPDVVGRDYYERTKRAVETGGGDPPALAAELTAFLLSDSAIDITGKLLSARWDPWREPEFQSRLRNEKDLATLRRIDDQFFTAIEQR